MDGDTQRAVQGGGSVQDGTGQDGQERHETPTEQLDRNWGDLLQELRVVQTGVQFLTGFLLTLPFQQTFAHLDDPQVAIYLSAVSASVVATAFLQAPVSLHRGLFRRHQRRATVEIAHRLAIVGMVFLSIAIVAVATLIFDVVVSAVAATVAGIVTAALLVALWVVLPTVIHGPRRRNPA